MGEYKLDLQSAELEEITLNKYGDKIFISADDANLLDKFISGCQAIAEMSEEVSKRITEIENKCDDQEVLSSDSNKGIVISRIRKDACKKSIDIIDEIFGKGTMKKSFRDEYEAMPDFIPDEDKITSFLDTISPIMEDIFGRKIKRQQAANKIRMEKYQPQDFKRSRRKK